jgi:undecaprenyl-diphosphatase
MDLLEGIDQGALYPFRYVAEIAALRPILIALYYLGHPFVLGGVLLLAVLWLLGRKEARTALLLAVTTLAAFGLAHAGKMAVNRTRPNLHIRGQVLDEPASPSFPSAHTLAGTALYASLGVIVARRLSRRWPRALGIALAFLAGLDRLLTCHNYLSDVLVGWAAGTVLAMICVDLDKRGQPT